VVGYWRFNGLIFERKGMVMGPRGYKGLDSFLFLYALPLPSGMVSCGSRVLKPVSFFPYRTLGGIHITMTGFRRGKLSFLSGYYECDGVRGFLEASAELRGTLAIREILPSEGWIFEGDGTFFPRGGSVEARVRATLPMRKTFSFMDVRHGVVYFRQDAGAMLSLLSVKGNWSAAIQKTLDSGWRVAAMGYRSSSIQTDQIVERGLLPVLDTEAMSGCPSPEGRSQESVLPLLTQEDIFLVQVEKEGD
jgi:hypothetical protein